MFLSSLWPVPTFLDAVSSAEAASMYSLYSLGVRGTRTKDVRDS